jgi:hypothetical protein
MGTTEEIRARVLAIQTDRKPHPLQFEGWGPGIYVRVLSADDQAALSETTAETEMPLRIVLACLVDAEGERIFTDEDRPALGAFPFPEIMTVFGEVAKLNGLSTKELDEAMASFAPAPDEQRVTG